MSIIFRCDAFLKKEWNQNKQAVDNAESDPLLKFYTT